MEDNFRSASDELVAAALEGVRRGNPAAVTFLYQHYDLLHCDTKRAVFLAMKQRFQLAGDGALAARLRLRGHADLATDYPQLTAMIRRRTNRALRTVARDLGRPRLGDINASSPAARYLREIVSGLPLTSFLGAKWMVLFQRWRRERARKRLAP